MLRDGRQLPAHPSQVTKSSAEFQRRQHLDICAKRRAEECTDSGKNVCNLNRGLVLGHLPVVNLILSTVVMSRNVKLR